MSSSLSGFSYQCPRYTLKFYLSVLNQVPVGHSRPIILTCDSFTHCDSTGHIPGVLNFKCTPLTVLKSIKKVIFHWLESPEGQFKPFCPSACAKPALTCIYDYSAHALVAHNSTVFDLVRWWSIRVLPFLHPLNRFVYQHIHPVRALSGNLPRMTTILDSVYFSNGPRHLSPLQPHPILPHKKGNRVSLLLFVC